VYRRGKITTLAGNAMRVELEPPSQSGCAGCQAPGSCGGLFNDWFQQRQQSAGGASPGLWLSRLPGVSIGESIRIDIDPSTALKLGFIAYGVPILLLIAGAVIALLLPVDLLWLEPLLGPLLATVGFIGGLIAYKPLYNHFASKAGQSAGSGSSPLLKVSRMMGKG